MEILFLIVLLALLGAGIVYKKQIEDFFKNMDAEEVPKPSSGTTNFGNIRAIIGEEKNPSPLPDTVHIFPDRDPPVTRFEELNWRLFVVKKVAGRTPEELPETTIDDFPTRFEFSSESDLIALCEKHLRPGYPVILDMYGWWALASATLEHNPDYDDAAVSAYLALPADKRPVIVSVESPEDAGEIIIMRYGFTHFHVLGKHLRPLMTQSFTNLFRALLGSRADWTWFSIARMRKTVTMEDRAVRQLANALIVATETQRARAAAEKHANRFVALWDLRTPATVKTIDQSVTDALSAELEDIKEEAKA